MQDFEVFNIYTRLSLLPAVASNTKRVCPSFANMSKIVALVVAVCAWCAEADTQIASPVPTTNTQVDDEGSGLSEGVAVVLVVVAAVVVFLGVLYCCCVSYRLRDCCCWFCANSAYQHLDPNGRDQLRDLERQVKEKKLAMASEILANQDHPPGPGTRGRVHGTSQTIRKPETRHSKSCWRKLLVINTHIQTRMRGNDQAVISVAAAAVASTVVTIRAIGLSCTRDACPCSFVSVVVVVVRESNRWAVVVVIVAIVCGCRVLGGARAVVSGWRWQ